MEAAGDQGWLEALIMSRLDHSQRRMCSQCPFRKNAAGGWLGAYTPQEVIDTVRSETPFPCHAQVDYDDPAWAEKLDGKPHCAGHMQMAKAMCKLPRDLEHSRAVRAIEIEKNHLGSPAAFLEHHQEAEA